jgi:hypothetical protein
MTRAKRAEVDRRGRGRQIQQAGHAEQVETRRSKRGGGGGGDDGAPRIP